MRLIDADALGIGKAKREAFENPAYADGWNSAIDIINNAPTADAEPVKHGRWIHTDAAASWDAKDECSACHYATADRIDLSYFNYCPNCGAKMDLEEMIGGAE